jgi:hypothetical protein
LAAPFCGVIKKHGQPALPQVNSYLLFSQDDGLTWGDARVIASDDYNETAVLRLRPDRWLAAARTSLGTGDARPDPYALVLFVSKDEGQTWVNSGSLTLPDQHPGHLLRLADGRILLTYGVREKDHRGIIGRVSGDEGRTWSAAIWIVHLEGTTDNGYPSTVQLPDGTLVTAYYSNGIPQHQRYHMGVVRYALEKLNWKPWKP